MKILVSLKHLAERLNRINFDKEQVEKVRCLDNNELVIITSKRHLTISCEVIDHQPPVFQFNITDVGIG